MLGVTATPLSSNINLPMKDNYDELIVGESIASLIELGYLARAVTYSHHVGLTSLKVGISGDYTVSSSERLYNKDLMQDKLLNAYQQESLGKKTLIFNNGIETSKHVCQTFIRAGYDIKHLDNTNSAKERREILQWFREKPDAILTSVSILTTGFDEPTVESIILNRATKSLTLYFQMIGRGSRVLSDKTKFTVIDLGNNLRRFGYWEGKIDWMSIFKNPELHLESILSYDVIERNYKYVMPDKVRSKFSKSSSIDFDVKEEHEQARNKRERSIVVIERSIAQHVKMCIENSTNINDALSLLNFLNDEIEYRIRIYSNCLVKTSKHYEKWLTEDYTRKLKSALIRNFQLPFVEDKDESGIVS
jgi:superfamily II DNA or RNA helicase